MAEAQAREAATSMSQRAYVPLEQRDGYRAPPEPQGQAVGILCSLQVMSSHKDSRKMGTLSCVVENTKTQKTQEFQNLTVSANPLVSHWQ